MNKVIIAVLFSGAFAIMTVVLLPKEVVVVVVFALALVVFFKHS